jgi:REP element-mobilizing transposase RayT
MALAYFITFTTYGTWLHGTAKGEGSVDLEHHAYGTPFLEPDSQRERDARGAMVQGAWTMGVPQREVVRDALVALAREKGWRLWAAHVRSNHVHAVISAARDPGRLMSDLQARATRDLSQAGFGDARRRRWTRHGSTRHLFSEEQVQEKIAYTLFGQGAPMALYDAAQDPRTAQEPRTK